MTRRAAWRGALFRWRWWIAAVGVVILVRVLLPEVLRRVLMSQASQTLNAQVDVGDVDLVLWRGGVVLEDVAVRRRAAGEPAPSGAPASPSPAAAAAPAPPANGAAAFGADPPLIAFRRFAVGLRYWPLFSKTVQLRDIELDGPRVALDRLASGDLNLAALVPKSEVAVAAGGTPGAIAATPTAPAGAAAGGGTPWKFGVDRFVLRDGRMRFRDLKLPGSEPVEVGIDQVNVQEIALSPGVYGEPARVHVTLGVDEGTVDVAAQLRLLDKGLAVHCDVGAERLPLRRARLYVPKVGWSDLNGQLDLNLAYELQTETEPKNAISGTLALRDVAVAVPHLQDVAVAWTRLAIDIGTIDLQAQRAAIRDVSLDGAKLYVRARGDQPLPVLAASAPAAPAGPSASASEPSPSPAAEAGAAPAEEPAKPWEWRVDGVHVADSKVLILSDQPTLELAVRLDGRDLAGAADAIGHVAAAIGLGESAVKVEGDVRLAAPAFGGTLQITDLVLPPLLAVSGAVDPALLPSATLGANLAIGAGLPRTGGAAVEPSVLAVSGTLGLRDVRAVPPGGSALSVDAKSLDLTLNDVAVPGVIPIGQKAAAGAALRLGAQLSIAEARLERGGEQPMTAALQSLDLALSDVSVPAAMAGLAPFDGNQPISATARLGLGPTRVTVGGDLEARADAVTLAVSKAALTAVPPGGSAAQAPAAQLAAQLDVSAPHVAIAGGKQLDAGAKAIGLALTELTAPGAVIGAPPVDTGQPLRAAATLTLLEPRAVRADGKEFSFTARSVAVPVTELAATGLLASASAPAPMRVALGDVRIDAPALRLTRTKAGLVLPAAAGSPDRAAPAAAPAKPAAAAAAPGPPATAPQVTVASLRISNGKVDFTDRAVQPVYETHLSPIELDARNVRYPDASVKPVRLEITSAEQGRITLNGEISPQGGEFRLAIADWPLMPFTPYASAYSPYSITDGALEITTKATFRGGKYDVTNDLTLHQFDLGGTEGDSLFEQQFGIPLSMALALLRDAGGDISLSIPVQVDQSGGATVDTVAVVRTALRQALLGAIQSPLKLVGGVLGVGGKSGAIAPAPIAFQLGRAEPTGAGAESAGRLGDFLTSRPGMAVQLATAVTNDDVRWLREQALRGEWQEESFLQRSIGFVTARGPRERIGDYLAARATGGAPELSADDAATLQRWLDERPAPSPAALRELAEARLAAVDAALRDKGIDAARIAHAESSAEPVDGAPAVRITFRPVAALTKTNNG